MPVLVFLSVFHWQAKIGPLSVLLFLLLLSSNIMCVYVFIHEELAIPVEWMGERERAVAAVAEKVVAFAFSFFFYSNVTPLPFVCNLRPSPRSHLACLPTRILSPYTSIYTHILENLSFQTTASIHTFEREKGWIKITRQRQPLLLGKGRQKRGGKETLESAYPHLGS